VGFVAKLKGDIIDLTLKTPVVILPGTKIGLARNIQGHWRLIGYGEAQK
jgi:translation initiation factor 2 gamma subunit (eIF-2gamma)